MKFVMESANYVEALCKDVSEKSPNRALSTTFETKGRCRVRRAYRCYCILFFFLTPQLVLCTLDRIEAKIVARKTSP